MNFFKSKPKTSGAGNVLGGGYTVEFTQAQMGLRLQKDGAGHAVVAHVDGEAKASGRIGVGDYVAVWSALRSRATMRPWRLFRRRAGRSACASSGRAARLRQRPRRPACSRRSRRPPRAGRRADS